MNAVDEHDVDLSFLLRPAQLPTGGPEGVRRAAAARRRRQRALPLVSLALIVIASAAVLAAERDDRQTQVAAVADPAQTLAEALAATTAEPAQFQTRTWWAPPGSEPAPDFTLRYEGVLDAERRLARFNAVGAAADAPDHRLIGQTAYAAFPRELLGFYRLFPEVGPPPDWYATDLSARDEPGWYSHELHSPLLYLDLLAAARDVTLEGASDGAVALRVQVDPQRAVPRVPAGAFIDGSGGRVVLEVTIRDGRIGGIRRQVSEGGVVIFERVQEIGPPVERFEVSAPPQERVASAEQDDRVCELLRTDADPKTDCTETGTGRQWRK